MESGQAVPEFLESFKPADEKVDFDDDSGAEEEEETPAGGETNGDDGWGSGGGDVSAPAPVDAGWGTADNSAGGGW